MDIAAGLAANLKQAGESEATKTESGIVTFSQIMSIQTGERYCIYEETRRNFYLFPV